MADESSIRLVDEDATRRSRNLRRVRNLERCEIDLRQRRLPRTRHDELRPIDRRREAERTGGHSARTEAREGLRTSLGSCDLKHLEMVCGANRNRNSGRQVALRLARVTRRDGAAASIFWLVEVDEDEPIAVVIRDVGVEIATGARQRDRRTLTHVRLALREVRDVGRVAAFLEVTRESVFRLLRLLRRGRFGRRFRRARPPAATRGKACRHRDCARRASRHASPHRTLCHTDSLDLLGPCLAIIAFARASATRIDSDGFAVRIKKQLTWLAT